MDDEHDDDYCPESDDHKHEPDWDTVVESSEGSYIYVDVYCRHCQHHGNVAMICKDSTISW